MENMRNWAMMLCVGIVLCGTLSYLLPEGSSGKSARTLISLFFLCLLLEPLGALRELKLDWPELQPESAYKEELSISSEELAYSLAEGHILELIQETLQQQGFPTAELTLSFEQEQILLSLTLPCSCQNREEELRQLLKNHCGVSVKAIDWQEDENMEE